MIDLDATRAARAAKREGRREHVTVRYGGHNYTLPVELPAAVVDLLLDGQLDMAGLIRTVIAVQSDPAADPDTREQAGALALEALLSQPSLPVDVLRTVRDAIATLFGDEQWQRFLAQNPSLPDLIALIRGLWTEYGVGLGEAWASSAPSANGGATSKPTSNGSTPSTPEPSGLTPATPGT